MKIKNIRENTTEELREQIKVTKREILSVRLKKATSDGTTDPSKVRSLRRDVARMNTVIREREIKKND